MRMHSALTIYTSTCSCNSGYNGDQYYTLSILRKWLRDTAPPPPPCFSQDFLHTVISSNLRYLSVSCHELLRRTCGQQMSPLPMPMSSSLPLRFHQFFITYTYILCDLHCCSLHRVNCQQMYQQGICCDQVVPTIKQLTIHNVFLLSTVVDCGTLSNPANGQVSHTAGTTYGETATYSCNTGYNRVGDSTRTCQAAGTWSGSEPTCQSMLLLPHSTVAKDKTLILSICSSFHVNQKGNHICCTYMNYVYMYLC